jgi:hypothetical protein
LFYVFETLFHYGLSYCRCIHVQRVAFALFALCSALTLASQVDLQLGSESSAFLAVQEAAKAAAVEEQHAHQVMHAKAHTALGALFDADLVSDAEMAKLSTMDQQLVHVTVSRIVNKLKLQNFGSSKQIENAYAQVHNAMYSKQKVATQVQDGSPVDLPVLGRMLPEMIKAVMTCAMLMAPNLVSQGIVPTPPGFPVALAIAIAACTAIHIVSTVMVSGTFFQIAL